MVAQSLRSTGKGAEADRLVDPTRERQQGASVPAAAVAGRAPKHVAQWVGTPADDERRERDREYWFAAAPVCGHQRASSVRRRPKWQNALIVCNNLAPFGFDLVVGHAWTPHRNFAVSKSLTQSLTVGGVAFEKTGEHRVTRRARHGPSGGVGSHRKRPRAAFASQSRCWEYWSVYELTHRAPDSRRSAGSRSTRTECPESVGRLSLSVGNHTATASY